MLAKVSVDRPWGGGGLGSALVLHLVAAFTTWVALLSWTGLVVAWGRFMGPLVMIAIVVAVSGALLRSLRVSGLLLVVGQLVVLGIVVSMQLTGVPVPIGGAWPGFEAAFQDSWASAQQYAAPVPRGAPPIDPVLIAAGAACMLVVDVVVGTMRRASLAGLPLLAIYIVPPALVGSGVSWVVFVLTAFGFLLMLYMEESWQIARWGRPLAKAPGAVDQDSLDVGAEARRSSALALGAIATALAIVAPTFIPHFGVDLPSGGSSRSGGGQRDIDIPMINMKRDLFQGEDVDLVTVKTDDPNPGYLRISVLNRFSDDRWTPGDRHADGPALGWMPSIQGLDPAVPIKEYQYQVEATDAFRYRWLPTQAPISRIVVEGDWSYDLSTMDVVALDDELTTRGISYSMTSVVPDLSSEAMVASSSVRDLVGGQFTELPPGLPRIVGRLALDVTRDQPTRFQKALALQHFFREDGGFRYVKKPPAGNRDALEDFLDETSPRGRRGFCVHFASAMAVMARAIDIPARVAFGLLKPDRILPDTYVYSAHDLHVWPELYFHGAGWVRFEPTPSSRAGNIPDYTKFPLEPSGTDLPNAVAPSDDSSSPRAPSAAPSPKPPVATARDGVRRGRTAVMAVAVLALLALLVATPRGVRRRRRRRRLSAGPELVWSELRDTIVDLGLGWPAGRSPRETGTYLMQFLGPLTDASARPRPRHGADRSPEAARALERIVSTIELHRYAPPGQTDVLVLRAEGDVVLTSLEAGATRAARRRAEWMPRSLFGLYGDLFRATPTEEPEPGS